MSENDIFRQLQSGIKFNKSKQRANFPKNNTTKPKEIVEELQLPSLDFFAAPENKSKKPPKKKQKISQSETNEEEQEQEEDKNKSKKSIKKLRSKHKIKTDKLDVPKIISTFSELKTRYQADKHLLTNVKKVGYTKPTGIQMQAIPILTEGNEVLACAPTGSGKTAAFTIPMLLRLKKGTKTKHRALILSPTRELAIQTYQQISLLTAGTDFRVCLLTKSTCPHESEDESQCRRFDIIVSTPLRLVRLIETTQIQLDTIEYMILDEADQLFELGFVKQIDEIIAACKNDKIVRALFSATIPEGVENMAKSFLHNPVRIVVGTKNSATTSVKQRLVFCGQEEGKLIALRDLIRGGVTPPVIIFVQSKERANQLYHELLQDNLHIDIISADRTKSQRDASINQFRQGNIWFLIATDLMARGMDFYGVNLVINYDIPTTPTQYIHRIGRAGRAGLTGEAVTFYTQADVNMLRSIVNVMKNSGMVLPEWLSEIKKITPQEQRMLVFQPPEREAICDVPEDKANVEKSKTNPLVGKKRNRQQN